MARPGGASLSSRCGGAWWALVQHAADQPCALLGSWGARLPEQWAVKHACDTSARLAGSLVPAGYTADRPALATPKIKRRRQGWRRVEIRPADGPVAAHQLRYMHMSDGRV